MPDKVHRAVEGLGDLMDDYEFHYPQELSPDSLDEVRAALGDHGIYAIASGLHLDARFGRGGLVSPDEATRAEARRITREAADFAGSIGAQFIVWPGIEGYNYPFQTPYADSWNWLIEGIGEAAEVCAGHGVKLFLEHKNSEPAMKILMRNMGMTLHVIHKLRAEGVDNVQVNMDWQHLIMNGEHLPEYAALLAAEGLLGHQHANSGWGTFDDDNMVGATAFMETARAGARAAPRRVRGRRRAARLRPLPVHRGPGGRRAALGRAVATSSTRAAARIDEAGARGGTAREGRRARLRDRVRGARRVTAVGLDVGTTALKGIALADDGSGARPRGARVRLRTRRGRAGPSRTPSCGGTPRRSVLEELRAAGEPDGIGLSGQMHGLVALDSADHGAAAGDPLERPAHRR